MLNVMRENLKHLKWVLWLTAISFILSFGYYFNLGGGSAPGTEADWAARVNGEPIPALRLRDATQNLDRNYRQMLGENYDSFKSSLQLGTQAVNSLIQQRLILDDSARLGLSATVDEIAEAIRTNPNFQDETGKFIGRDRYVTLIDRSRVGGGVAGFERLIADEIVINKWMNLVSQAVQVSDRELEDLYRQRNEKTVLDFFVVASADQDIDTKVADGDLQAWYDTHLEDYRRGPGRRIRSIVVSREAQLDKVTVGDEEIQAYYDGNQQNYSHDEQREVRHILFRIEPTMNDEQKAAVRKQAEDVLSRVREGEDFAELAQAMSQDPGSAARGGSLGYFGRGQMVPPFEQAAFETATGEFAPLTETQFGFHVIQVTGAREAGVTPLDQVRDEIVQTLRLKQAQDRVVSEAQRLAEELTSPDQIETVGTREGLEVETRFVTEDSLAEVGADPAFVETIFSTAVGGVTPPLRIGAGMTLAGVIEDVPAAVAPLDEIKEKVQTDLLNDRARRAAEKLARRTLDRRKTVAAAAKALDKEVRPSGDLRAGQSPPATGGSTPELQAKLFGPEAAAGDRGVIAVPAGALVYEITERQQFDPAAFEVERETLREETLRSRGSQLQQAMVDKLRGQQQVEINQPLVERFNG